MIEERANKNSGGEHLENNMDYEMPSSVFTVTIDGIPRYYFTRLDLEP